MIFRRRLLRVIAAVIALAVGAQSAWACSCRELSAEELVSKAPVIFRGTMLYSLPELWCRGGSASDCAVQWVGTFSVDEKLRGDLGSRVRIELSTALSCGPVFHVGEPASVAAIGDPVFGYEVMICGFVPMRKEGQPDLVAEAAMRFREQLEELDAAVATRPDDTSALFAKAKFLNENGGPWEAQEPLDELLRLDSVHRDAVLLRARLFVRYRRDLDVLDTLAPFLEAHPGDTEAMRLRVDSLIRTDQTNAIPLDWRDFADLLARGADFSHLHLDGATFHGAQLSAPLFVGADLVGADFSRVYIWDGDFSDANLTGASLHKAYFGGVVLSRAKLDGADLTRADLRGADLAGASLNGANLSGAFYNDATVWPEGFDPATSGAIKQR